MLTPIQVSQVTAFLTLASQPFPNGFVSMGAIRGLVVRHQAVLQEIPECRRTFEKVEMGVLSYPSALRDLREILVGLLPPKSSVSQVRIKAAKTPKVKTEGKVEGETKAAIKEAKPKKEKAEKPVVVKVPREKKVYRYFARVFTDGGLGTRKLMVESGFDAYLDAERWLDRRMVECYDPSVSGLIVGLDVVTEVSRQDAFYRSAHKIGHTTASKNQVKFASRLGGAMRVKQDTSHFSRG